MTDQVSRPRPRNPPTVSVCVPAYRAEPFLAATIDSVLAQTWTDWELIVLDNNSADRTGEIARSYRDPRIQVTANLRTLDLPGNWNAVAGLATGRYLKVLCADDLLHPDCLSDQVAVLEARPDVSLVSSRRHFIAAGGQVVLRDQGLTGLLGHHPAEAVVQRVVRSGINPIGWPAAMLFRRADFEAAGAFDGRWLYPMDLELALRLLQRGSFVGLPASHASFRISPGSASSTMSHQGAQHRAMLRSLMAEHRWSIDRRWLRRGLALSYVESVRKALLFSAVNSRWRPVRRLPGLVLGSRSRSRAGIGPVESYDTQQTASTPLP